MLDSDVIVVPDVLLALQSMARAKRDAFEGPVIAVTGSNGKTCEGVACALAPARRAIHQVVVTTVNLACR